METVVLEVLWAKQMSKEIIISLEIIGANVRTQGRSNVLARLFGFSLIAVSAVIQKLMKITVK